jgi:hypothetical protein
MPDGSLDSFTQVEDGFPQGYPLSPDFACLVINCILQELNETLHTCAQTWCALKSHDQDGCGSKSVFPTYFDDAFSSFLPYKDLPIFIQTFQQLGAPMEKAAHNFVSATKPLTKRIDDPQSIATLFKYCTLPSISHLLDADILHHSDINSTPVLDAWTSPLMDALQATNYLMLKHITNTTSLLPALSLCISHLPLHGGIGRGLDFYNHPHAALPSFLSTSTAGIPYRHLDKTHALCPSPHICNLSTW